MNLEEVIAKALEKKYPGWAGGTLGALGVARTFMAACRVALCTDPTLATSLGAVQSGIYHDDNGPTATEEPLYRWPVVSPETEGCIDLPPDAGLTRRPVKVRIVSPETETTP